MFGLVLKDFYNMKSQLKSYLIIFVFYIVISIFMENPIFMNVLIVIMLSMMPISTFSYDNYCKWDNYQLSLPITRKQAVGAKYLFSAIPMILGFLFTLVFSLLFFLSGKGDLSLTELLATSYVGIAMGILYLSVLIPAVYHFGPEKSRNLSFAVFGIPFVLFFVVIKLGKIKGIRISITDEQFFFLLKLSPLFLILILVISILLSIRIYERKEL